MADAFIWGLTKAEALGIGVGAIGALLTGLALFPKTDKPRFQHPNLINIPPAIRTVQGRGGIVKDLRQALTLNKRAAIVFGDGGIGKTTLARYYVERYKLQYAGILWVNAETSVAPDLAMAAGALAVELKRFALNLNHQSGVNSLHEFAPAA